MDVFDLLDDLNLVTKSTNVDGKPVPQAQRYYKRAPLNQFHEGTQAQRSRSLKDDAYDESYDDFDRELLAQPFVDRRLQAEQGTARLSLAPSTSRGTSTSKPQYSNFSQYGHSVNAVSKTSSSPPHVVPSSPSLDVGKRRDHGRRIMTLRPVHQTSKSAAELSRSTNARMPHPGARPQDQIPVVHGVRLIPRSVLPDRFRTVFPFPLFNAVQSKSFDKVYNSDNNFVLSSPTGSGKTAILELAICRAISQYPSGQFKIVYQAPFKALCSERHADWQKKFGPLDLPCAELTGDTEVNELKNVQNATIIITTPEKWDSLTRKWKDHERLMRLVKLFLIDEVHVLKDERGPTLEAIVSRMKSVGTDMRFVALSATVPNLEDIGSWLGKNGRTQDQPAPMERFGEELRPVVLEKHVCVYNNSSGNDFAFDGSLTSKLFEVIPKYSHRKPIMVFCMTQKSTISTAKALAKWWSDSRPKNRFWNPPKQSIPISDADLRGLATSGVAFHHGSVDTNDRHLVERGYLSGDISVICCTSTLAVGINLPCHFVIIKNTVAWSGSGPREYSDLEVMQMLGRAGRPQFDKTAVGVIMTSHGKADHYENLVSGQELLESQLHLNLIEHLNAEVTLGTISDLESAKRWLAGTFLSVRLQKNPNHYKIGGIAESGSFDERLSEMCSRNVKLLKQHELVNGSHMLRSTEYGDAMARYYVQFDTMLLFMSLPRQAKVSEILSILAQAVEYKDVRFRAPEKSIYKEINQSNLIKFNIKVDLALPAHKTTLIMQMALGGIEYPRDDKALKFLTQFSIDQGIIFKHINRLIRCVIDCQLYREDALAARNALLLERSFSARAWDDSPLQLLQFEKIGPVAARKLIGANISSIEDLENTEPHRIETILVRYPPFGRNLLASLKSFPRLRIGIQMTGHSVLRSGEGVKINVKADIGFMNDKPPVMFNKRPVFVCVLAETSDGRIAHFARTSAKKLNAGQDLFFSATLSEANQNVVCYVMCESIAGTLRHASLTHSLPSQIFPRVPKAVELPPSEEDRPLSNISRRRADIPVRRRSGDASEDFSDDDLDDEDFTRLVNREDVKFEDIDEYEEPVPDRTHRNTVGTKQRARSPDVDNETVPPQMTNGNYYCNHPCKNKQTCKHLCCREGTDRPPKRPTKKRTADNHPLAMQRPSKAIKKELPGSKNQTKLDLSITKLAQSFNAPVIKIDLTQSKSNHNLSSNSRPIKGLQRLQDDTQAVLGKPKTIVPNITHTKPHYSYANGKGPNLSFLPMPPDNDASSDYSDLPIDDISPSKSPLQTKAKFSLNDDEDDDIESLEAAMIGVATSQDINAKAEPWDDAAFDDAPFDIYEDEKPERQRFMQHDVPESRDRKVPVAQATPAKSISLFVTGNTSSAGQSTEKQMKMTETASGFFKSQTIESENQRQDTKHEEEKTTQNEPPVVVPPGYEDVDPWLIAEFGDIVDFT